MLSAAGFGVLATPALAGAVAAHQLHANTIAPSEQPSAVTPLSGGYYEVTLADGATSLANNPTPTQIAVGGIGDPRPDKSSISIVAGQGLTGVLLTLPSGDSIQAGEIYTSDDPGVSILAGAGDASCSSYDGDVMAVEVDQITWTAVGTNQFYAPTVAMQFSCLQADGVSVYGAFAFNVVPTTPGQGYYTYESDGTITGFGNDSYLNYLGDLSVTPLNKPIVGMAITPDGGGYYLVASDGGIFSYGDATFYGSTGSIRLNKPIVGMATTPDGKGYWLVASDGGIFSYGDAAFYGSTGSVALNKPIVGMAATANGNGYWLVASDGGIFAYGNAPF